MEKTVTILLPGTRRGSCLLPTAHFLEGNTEDRVQVYLKLGWSYLLARALPCRLRLRKH